MICGGIIKDKMTLNESVKSIEYVLLDDNAIPPLKKHSTDAGWDLTLINLRKIEGGVYYYGTGIAIAPQKDYYCHIYGRSSLAKFGYMMVDVGIIDWSYRGELIVPLFKFNQNAPDLQLPFRAAQLVMMPNIVSQLKYVDRLDDTLRGAGGFGSTN